MDASPARGKIVMNPSSAAVPGLSVTPALKPIVIALDGASGKCVGFDKRRVFVPPSSMIGSANKSSTRSAICSAGTSVLIRKPTTLRTLSTLMPWSAASCRRTTSPRTSRIPGPCFGVTSTRVMAMGFTAPYGGELTAIAYAP